MAKFTLPLNSIVKKGKTYSVFVKKFKPFFYLKVNDHWNKDKTNNFKKFLLKKYLG